ncbi:hypothetical protein F4679DRAFT_437434 [Xylaria curta]|nr:hypothetical protein F4679DRAFT_437434 [Xylaria curta]
MNQQRNNDSQGSRISSQASRDYEDVCSNKATSGSSDSGSDNLDLSPTRSRSSERDIQQLTTMRHKHNQQASQTSDPDPANAIPRTLSHDGSSFMGLTLTPLPSAMLPMKKRPLDELLKDKTPPEKDKMSAEIDQLASETPSGTCDVAPDEPPRRKRGKASEESIPRALPIIMGDSNRRGRAPRERRSEHPTNASHRGGRPTSD